MNRQPGDKPVSVAGETITLRLTMGSLAEISEHLEAPGPRSLAARLRDMTAEDARIIAQVCCVERRHCAVFDTVSEAAIAALLPTLAALFTEAFHA